MKSQLFWLIKSSVYWTNPNMSIFHHLDPNRRVRGIKFRIRESYYSTTRPPLIFLLFSIINDLHKILIIERNHEACPIKWLRRSVTSTVVVTLQSIERVPVCVDHFRHHNSDRTPQTREPGSDRKSYSILFLRFESWNQTKDVLILERTHDLIFSIPLMDGVLSQLFVMKRKEKNPLVKIYKFTI